MGSHQKYAGKKSLCKLLADKDLISYGTTKAFIDDPNNKYYQSMYDYYETDDKLTDDNGTFYRGNYRYQLNNLDATKIHERNLYQIKAILKKLGLDNKIDYNNVCHIGLSAGGWAGMVSHNMTNGIARSFTLNDSSGNPTTIKPFIWNLKNIIGWQPCLMECTKFKGFIVANQSIADKRVSNNRNLIGIDYLKVPYMIITGDGDIGSNSNTGLVPSRDFFYSHQYQSLFQLTKLKAETDLVALKALSKSIIIYKPTIAHIASEGILDIGDGETGGIFTSCFATDWLNGWYLPQNIVYPIANDVIQNGLNNELIYGQLEDLKITIIIQLMVHRFLGNDYPVPASILNSLNIKYNIMPTHANILTDHEYMKIGPLNRISYDNNYNLNLTTNGSLITDAKSLILKSEDGSKTYKLIIDSSGNIKALLQ